MSATMKAKSNENIQVYVRCRPTNNRERSIHSCEMVKIPSDREVIVKQMMDNRMTKKFTFDRAFGPDSTQSDVYSVVVAPLITEVLAGYNCTVFAYGQTGTGKTHTMIGEETPQIGSSYEDASTMGIIPRALAHLFEELRLMDVEFSMRISYLELYNEELCDLLSSSDFTQIRIFEDPNKKGSIIVQGLEEIPVHSAMDVYKLLAKGQEKRKMASTLMNAQSSRSHTVFSILVHIKENGMDGEELLKIGKLNLVDLAGSENISKAGNEKGIRTRETVNINQSLLTLGRVITALVERTPHVPYRESKLTRLLQESLGGRTKTSIIATISPGHKDLEETMSTLEYANRAKNIQNKPELNQKLTKKIVLKEYTEEIDRLKRDLMAARDKNGVYLAEETYNQMQYQLDSQNKELSEQIVKLKAQKDDLAKKQQLMNEINVELDKRTKELKDTETVLGKTEEVLDKAKRGYQEKKQILLRHMKTEEILTHQARQLIDVADTATKDVSQLQETIARRKNYDHNNREACKTLDTTMNNHLGTMAENLKTFTNGFNDLASSVIKKMDSNTNQCRTMCSASISNLRLLIEYEQQGKSSIDQCVANHKEQFSDLFTKHSEANQNILKDAVEMKKELSKQLDALQSHLNETFKAFESNHNHLLELINKNSATVTDFCESLSNNLQTNSANAVQSLRNNRRQIDESTATNDLIATSMKGLLDELNGLITQSKANNETIKQILPDLKSQEIRIENQLTENLTAIDAYSSQMTSEITTFTSTMGLCDESVKTIQSNSLEIVRINKQKDEQLISCVTEMELNFAKQKNEVSAKLDEMVNEVIDTSELTKINVDGGLYGIIDDISNEQDRLDGIYDEFNELMSNLELAQKEYQDKLSSDIASCANRLEIFQKNDLQVYTPTGQTPSKRDYIYPKVLAATSPHAKIVREFWNNHQANELECSAIIHEEQREAHAQDESANDENEISTNSNASDTTTVCNMSDRTLCDSRTFNANSISTPIVNGDNIRKGMVLMENISNIISSEIPEEDKEN